MIHPSEEVCGASPATHPSNQFIHAVPSYLFNTYGTVLYPPYPSGTGMILAIETMCGYGYRKCHTVHFKNSLIEKEETILNFADKIDEGTFRPLITHH